MKKIIFTVTNDLNVDQRMIRICTALSQNNFEVQLVGRQLPHSPTLIPQPFQQKRIRCFINTSFLFYIEYNIRLFFFLLFQKTDAFCAIDMDTILANYLASVCRGKTRIYDAHEYFSEMKEVLTRPTVHKVWSGLEKFCIPRFRNGYTVCQYIAVQFKTLYQVDYKVIRNVPFYRNTIPKKFDCNHIQLYYQGAVNKGRGFEWLVPAMQEIDATLYVYGIGNYLEILKQDVRDKRLTEKIHIEGFRNPKDLPQIAEKMDIGLLLMENCGKNLYYSLANRFFDYMMDELPQICMDYPEYRSLNDKYGFALLIPNLEPKTIQDAVAYLQQNPDIWYTLQENCRKAKKILCWEEEQKILIDFYRHITYE